jgi:hypothetical protein
MTAGAAFIDYGGYRVPVKWIDGEIKKNFWTVLSTGLSFGARKAGEVSSRRCSQCGFIELYADTGARPVKTLTTVQDETERLNNLVTKLQRRIAVLEEIATDPAERTAREIESLRSLPQDRDERGRD